MNRMIRLFLPLPLLLAIVAGCASSKKPSVITGKVTFNGATVRGGVVGFHRTVEELTGGVAANIDKDGNYTVSGVPPGEVIVTVDTEPMNPDHPKAAQPYGSKAAGGKNVRPQNQYRDKMKEQGVAGAAQSEGDADRYTKIPSKYSDKKTSTLKTTVKSGSNTYNIEMTD
jgi:hypothetical protein